MPDLAMKPLLLCNNFYLTLRVTNFRNHSRLNYKNHVNILWDMWKNVLGGGLTFLVECMVSWCLCRSMIMGVIILLKIHIFFNTYILIHFKVVVIIVHIFQNFGSKLLWLFQFFKQWFRFVLLLIMHMAEAYICITGGRISIY